jgi:hypothetical protein
MAAEQYESNSLHGDTEGLVCKVLLDWWDKPCHGSWDLLSWGSEFRRREKETSSTREIPWWSYCWRKMVFSRLCILRLVWTAIVLTDEVLVDVCEVLGCSILEAQSRMEFKQTRRTLDDRYQACNAAQLKKLLPENEMLVSASISELKSLIKGLQRSTGYAAWCRSLLLLPGRDLDPAPESNGCIGCCPCPPFETWYVSCKARQALVLRIGPSGATKSRLRLHYSIMANTLKRSTDHNTGDLDVRSITLVQWSHWCCGFRNTACQFPVPQGLETVPPEISFNIKRYPSPETYFSLMYFEITSDLFFKLKLIVIRNNFESCSRLGLASCFGTWSDAFLCSSTFQLQNRASCFTPRATKSLHTAIQKWDFPGFRILIGKWDYSSTKSYRRVKFR